MGSIFNDDFRDFISALNGSEVDYILVGGYSVILHGYKRVTGDMDIWVDKTLENYQKIVRAFEVFGMPIFDMTPSKFISKSSESEVFRFGVSPSRIDLMTKVKGMNFQECSEAAQWFEEEGIKVRVIHYNHLLKSKEASNREKDRLDILNLKK